MTTHTATLPLPRSVGRAATGPATGPASGGPIVQAWTVLICGDRSRGDDGAALAAVERLPRRLRAEVRIRPCSLLGPDELLSALLSGPCLVLDTVHGVAPGSILELSLVRLLGGDRRGPASIHALPMPMVIGLAASLGVKLEDGAFLGIGGSALDSGERLSLAVDAALPAYVAAIVAHLRVRHPASCAP